MLDEPLVTDHFQYLRRYEKLHHFAVRHSQWSLPLLGQTALNDIMSSCRNLRSLSLTLSDVGEEYFDDVDLEDAPSREEIGLDVSILQTIAVHLPQLTTLELTLVARDSSGLEADSSLNRLQHLQTFTLKCSLLNWLLPGFNPHQVSRYISAIVSPNCKFFMQEPASEPYGGDDGWDEYFAKYIGFVDDFAVQVNNYIEIRAGELSRPPLQHN